MGEATCFIREEPPNPYDNVNRDIQVPSLLSERDETPRVMCMTLAEPV